MLWLCSRDGATGGQRAGLSPVPVPGLRAAVQRAQLRCAEQGLPAQRHHRLRGVLPLAIDLHEASVSRWVKPGAGQFRIEYRRAQSYEPDFVVETATEKLIVEIKARRDLETGFR